MADRGRQRDEHQLRPRSPALRLQTPAVYVEEVAGGPAPISGTPTSITAFVGRAATGPVDVSVPVGSWADFERQFGGLEQGTGLAQGVRDFFTNGGTAAVVVRATHEGRPADLDDGAALDVADYTARGLPALRGGGPFNLLCLPPSEPEGELPEAVWAEALALCVDVGAFLLVDPPPAARPRDLGAWATARGLTGHAARHAALYFPRLRQSVPVHPGAPLVVVPSGAVAGVYARIDAAHGVWKAPAGSAATLLGVEGPAVTLTDADQHPGVNVLRSFPAHGTAVWGARTLRGPGDDFTYVQVQRLALFVAHSLERGTQWAVFEPNGEPLWARLRLVVGAFLNTLWRQGAMPGSRPQEAYFVKCDPTTMTADDIASGRVVVLVGLAAVKPAEFVTVHLQVQLSGAS